MFLGPLIVNYIGAICCFGFSTIYHLFNSHSKRIMTYFIKFDYAGICLMIAGSSTPPIYYAFACPQLRPWGWFYLGMIYAFSSITLICMMIPYFDRDDMHAVRAKLYMVTGLSAIIPVTHIILFIDAEYLQDFHLFWWVLGGVFYLVGASLYIMQVPEKCCPCKFDIVGNSHQLFHLCIVLAALSHYYAGIQIFHQR